MTPAARARNCGRPRVLACCYFRCQHGDFRRFGLSCGVVKHSQNLSNRLYSGRRNGARFFVCLVITSVIAGTSLQADASLEDAARAEIEYLLDRLGSSGCEFFRNGDWYDASRARQHIERKYNWLVKRDLVASAEQFIERAATESSRSGESYLVRCAQSEPVPSAHWLTDALMQHRNADGARRAE